MNFTGTNTYRLTGQISMSFVLVCSLDNTTGTGEFGFSDQGSNTIKFIFEAGKVMDPDGRNIFTYTEDKNFTISGNISATEYSYKINDIPCAEGITKTSFGLEEFFINTDNAVNISADLKIYAPETAYSLTVPESIYQGDTFNITLNNDSSDSTIHIFAASLDTGSSSSFSIASFTAPITINPSNNGSISLTNTNTSITFSVLELSLFTSIGTIKKTISLQVNRPPTYTTANTLALVSATDVTGGKEYLYKFTSSVYKYDHESYANTGYISQQSTITLEYVSGNIGAFHQVYDVDVTDGGQGYTDPTLSFQEVTCPDVRAEGTAGESSGVIDSVVVTNIGSLYDAIPSVTFSDPDQNASGAEGTALTSSYNKTFTACFDVGTGTSSSPTVDFLSQGLTQDEGDVSYPHSTFGPGMYQSNLVSIDVDQSYYIKIAYTDKTDLHPISVKLKVTNLYEDTDDAANQESNPDVEEATIEVEEITCTTTAAP